VEFGAFTIRVDYKPRALDIAALRGGSVAEVLNIMPWAGVRLELAKVRLTALPGWGAAGGEVAGAWLRDVAATQAHKFVRGMAGIRPLVAIGSGTARLFVAPIEGAREGRFMRGLRAGAAAVRGRPSLASLALRKGLS
jgi:autophagy-related protein 2